MEVEKIGTMKTVAEIAVEAFGPRMKKEKSEVIFAKFPSWVVFEGLLPELTVGDLRLLNYLCVVRFMPTGNSSRTRETMAARTGLTIRQISVISGRLALYGIIKKWRKQKRVFYHVNLIKPEGWTKPPIGKSQVGRNRTHIQNRDENGMFLEKSSPSKPSISPPVETDYHF